MLCESLADGHSVARTFHPANVNIRLLESPKRFQNELPVKVQHLCGLASLWINKRGGTLQSTKIWAV